MPPQPQRATPGAPDERVHRRASVPGLVWRGTSLLVMGRMWGSACTFVALYLLARHLPSDAFGRYTFYLAIFVFLDSLADFGTGKIAVQRTAADAQSVARVLAATRRIRFAMGLTGVVLVGGGAFAFGEHGAGWILLASLYPLTHVLELSTTVFRNRIHWRVPVAMRALGSAMSLGFVLVLLGRGDVEPAHYLCAVAAGSAIANGLLHLASRRHLPGPTNEALELRAVFMATLPLGIAGLCQQAYFYVDNLFVRVICGEEALGYYNVGMRVLSYTIMVALYSTQAALPWLTREHARGELSSAVARLAQPLFALAGLGAGLAFPWAAEILSLFGAQFVAAGPSLRWLLCASTVIYAGAALMTGLLATGRMRTMLVISVSALIVNLVANFALIPPMGIEGAGLATFLTESSVLLGAGWALSRGSATSVWSIRPWGWAGGPVLFVFAALASSIVFPLVRGIFERITGA